MSNISGEKVIEYLKILGLSTTEFLTLDKLKSNYRKLAKYYHPDNLETGDEAKFKLIQESYEKCRDNLDYVNDQIKNKFSYKASREQESSEEKAFYDSCTMIIISLRAFSWPIDKLLNAKELELQYEKMVFLLTYVLKDQKNKAALDLAYNYCINNIDYINKCIKAKFNYEQFKANNLSAERKQQEEKERNAREKAEKERQEKERLAREEEKRRKAEEERKRKEAELKAKKEKEAAAAKVLYINLINEEIEKIIYSDYTEQNANLVRTIIKGYKRKEKSIDNTTQAKNVFDEFKKTIKKVRTIEEQKRIKKKIIFSGIVAGSVAFLIMLVFFIRGIVINVNNSNKYDDAISLMKNNKFNEAKAFFSELDTYKDSSNKTKVCDGLILLETAIKDRSIELATRGIKKIVNSGENVEVAYTSSDGLKISNHAYAYNEIIKSSTFSYYFPTKNDGYSFVNWIPNGLIYNKETCLSLDSKWEKILYSITYDLDGGTISNLNPSSYYVDSEINLSNPSKEGYKFGGWILNGEKVNVIKKGTTGNLSLKAYWEKIYSISYELNDGLNPETNPLVYTISDEIKLKSPTREGYVGFWTLNGIKTTKIKKGTTGDLVLVANWLEEYNSSSELLLSTPTKEGYIFEGWYDINDVRIFTLPSNMMDNTKIYAKWVKDDYIKISTIEDFMNISNNPEANYLLINDLDFSGMSFTSFDFKGVFNGGMHKILNISHNLFNNNYGNISNCLIRNNDTMTNGTSSFAYKNYGIIQYCSFEGDINYVIDDSYISVGGIASVNIGTIEYCYFKGNLSAITHSNKGYSADAGGIAGRNSDVGKEQGGNAIIRYCYALGNVYAEGNYCSGYAGGIVGINYYGYKELRNCYFIGSVEGKMLQKTQVYYAGAGTISGGYFAGSSCYTDENTSLKVTNGRKSYSGERLTSISNIVKKTFSGTTFELYCSFDLEGNPIIPFN